MSIEDYAVTISNIIDALSLKCCPLSFIESKVWGNSHIHQLILINFLNSELPDLLHSWDNDVCVVGIFGHSNSSKTKALPINDIIGRTVFQVR